MIQRRSLIAGLGALLAAPAIIRTPGLLMKVRPLRQTHWFPLYEGLRIRRLDLDEAYRELGGENEMMWDVVWDVLPGYDADGNCLPLRGIYAPSPFWKNAA